MKFITVKSKQTTASVDLVPPLVLGDKQRISLVDIRIPEQYFEFTDYGSIGTDGRYGNKLKKATSFMRIGVNSDLNIPVRRSALKHNLGSRAVKLPHSGVETRVVKSGTKEKQVAKSKTSEKSKTTETRDSETGDSGAGVTKETSETKTVSTSHETNLNVLIIVAGGLAWFLFR